jgi:hypothetical protein
MNISNLSAILLVLLGAASQTQAAERGTPRFRAVQIDPGIEIGYGLAIADVDGDNKPDIILVDKKQIVWYRNPSWEKFVIAENLTKLDNVCVAAADLDGDGKAEIAVGAGWNPSDTVNSGAVFYLIPPPDRTKKWEPVELAHEPTVHRMHWLRDGSGHFELIVAPLHGRGNQNGEGGSARILAYQKPADPHAPWKTHVVNQSLSLHMSHNLDVMKWTKQPGDELLVAAKEGIFHLTQQADGWKSQQLAGKSDTAPDFAGAGEIRTGRLPNGASFLISVEPMHGNQVVIYTRPETDKAQSFWQRHVLDHSLKEGHAVACADFLGAGYDQAVVGWRTRNGDGKVGIRMFIPEDKAGKEWRQTWVDDNEMACEDLRVADLNGDGRPDIVASGRATKNVKVYFNLGPE